MGKRNFTLNYTEKELQDWQNYLLQCIASRTANKALAKKYIQDQTLAKKQTSDQTLKIPKQSIVIQTYTLRQLCKKTEKEILIINTSNRATYKELKKCTDVEIFFKDYKKLQENQVMIKKLSGYLGNQELPLFLTDRMPLELLNDFLKRTVQLNNDKSLWFSQVSHHFDEMNEAQIALACTLAKIFENN